MAVQGRHRQSSRAGVLRLHRVRHGDSEYGGSILARWRTVLSAGAVRRGSPQMALGRHNDRPDSDYRSVLQPRVLVQPGDVVRAGTHVAAVREVSAMPTDAALRDRNRRKRTDRGFLLGDAELLVPHALGIPDPARFATSISDASLGIHGIHSLRADVDGCV